MPNEWFSSSPKLNFRCIGAFLVVIDGEMWLLNSRGKLTVDDDSCGDIWLLNSRGKLPVDDESCGDTKLGRCMKGRLRLTI